MTAPQPQDGPVCGRCNQWHEALFPSRENWGPRVPGRLCVRCWSRYSEARDARPRRFLDAVDAFDNATDAEMERVLFA